MSWHAQLALDLAPGAELMGWDITALGSPLANQPFVLGSLHQRIELPGVCHAQVVVVRALAPVVEPVMNLLSTLRNTWRSQLWSKVPSSPRIWSM
jgi:urease accessory protein